MINEINHIKQCSILSRVFSTTQDMNQLTEVRHINKSGVSKLEALEQCVIAEDKIYNNLLESNKSILVAKNMDKFCYQNDINVVILNFHDYQTISRHGFLNYGNKPLDWARNTGYAGHSNGVEYFAPHMRHMCAVGPEINSSCWQRKGYIERKAVKYRNNCCTGEFSLSYELHIQIRPYQSITIGDFL